MSNHHELPPRQRRRTSSAVYRLWNRLAFKLLPDAAFNNFFRTGFDEEVLVEVHVIGPIEQAEAETRPLKPVVQSNDSLLII